MGARIGESMGRLHEGLVFLEVGWSRHDLNQLGNQSEVEIQPLFFVSISNRSGV